MKPQSTQIIDFQGKLTFERIGILLNDLKIRKEEFDIKPVDYKKLLALMIEILENILKYSDHFDDFTQNFPEYLPEFEISKNHSSFIIISRNPVVKYDLKRVETKIEKVNSYKDEELKQYYREIITNGMFTEKGGAGLGFIEMVKITGNPLAYSFRSLREDYSSFELKLCLNLSK